MVGWLRPKLLVAAGLEVALSSLFARFVDKREVEAALPSEPALNQKDPVPYADEAFRDENGALWFDYASDVGEGFDPTYTVAWLLGRPALSLTGDTHGPRTKRGRFLVLGGDQVYPSAGWPAYRDRFVGPYRAAVPYLERNNPHIYAIPGNHDWYDGLTSFMRLFCQAGWIGAWQTRQARSYFALRLSDRWSLWATDTQFDTYMDGPQVEYFRARGRELEADHRVILVTAKPSWLKAGGGEPGLMSEGSWDVVRFVEEELAGGKDGTRVAVTITGDKHHYARYERRAPGNPRHRITAGGGGAHTSATHYLEDHIHLPPAGSGVPVCYERVVTSPTPGESRVLRRTAVGRIAREFPLGWVTGTIYAVLALLIADGIKDQGTGLESELLGGSFFGLLADGITVWSVGFVALLALALRVFALRGGISNGLAWLFSIGHTLAHVLPAAGLTVLGLLLLEGWEGAAERGLALGWVVAIPLFAVGFLYGSLVLAGYLGLANLAKPWHHATEIFGGLASTEYKNFLRFRLDSDERLTIYPIGIRECPRWEVAQSGGESDPWFEPHPAEPEARLIEAPIRIDPE